MDEIIQKAFPTVLAPRFTKLEPMTSTGERFVLTSRRLMFEVSRPWLHAVRCISGDFQRTTPYGDSVPEAVTLRCGPVPKALLSRFIGQAREVSPNETAAWVVWDENSKEFDYLPLQTLSASPVRVHFERPVLPSGSHLVMDIHSHGDANASFSATDNADDADQLCISVVVGRVNQEQPAILARLSMLGVYTPLGDI
jgi:PRTRC genetic system protein A